MSTIKPSQLANEIMRCLNEYTEEVTEALEDTKKELAKEGVRTLKQTSPRRPRGGKYAKGWKVTKQGTKYIVHNRHYQLPHLLEKGHAKRGGGTVGAIVHIKPVEERIAREAPERFWRILK